MTDRPRIPAPADPNDPYQVGMHDATTWLSTRSVEHVNNLPYARGAFNALAMHLAHGMRAGGESRHAAIAAMGAEVAMALEAIRRVAKARDEGK